MVHHTCTPASQVQASMKTTCLTKPGTSRSPFCSARIEGCVPEAAAVLEQSFKTITECLDSSKRWAEITPGDHEAIVPM